MAANCEFSVEKLGVHYCTIKNEAVSPAYYQDYCAHNCKEACPLYLIFQKYC